MSEQLELSNMPEETPLGMAARRFVSVKEEIAQAKLALDEVEKDILSHMKTENVPNFKISVGGENYEFELMVSQESVRCVKITKTAKKREPAETEAAPV